MSFNKLDLKLWKEIQDNLAEVLDIHIKLEDINEKEIIKSGKTPFYIQLIKTKDPFLADKNNGIKNITKDIMLHGESIGKIIAGPISFDQNFNLKELAAELNIDSEELIDAKNEIKILSKEKEDTYRKIITLFSEILPRLTSQQYTKDKDLVQLKTLQDIIRKVNSTLDLDEILTYIMNFLVNSLNATDCSVFVYQEDQEKKYVLKKEAENLNQIEKQVAKKALEEKKPIIIKDISQKFNISVDKDYNSIFVLPLRNKDELIGTISLYDKTAEFKQEDMEFISTIADQIAIAISNAAKFSTVKELAVIDKLTGVANRRYFTEQLEKALKEKITVENPISIILLDVDNFGKYNNTHGHPKGDELLKNLAKVIKKNIRDQDVIGRYGGEEFIVLIKSLNPQKSLEIAERIRDSVSEYPFEGRETQPGGKVTISLGLVSCRTNLDAKQLIKEADESLYKAKNSGKNKVTQKIILTKNLKTEI